MKGCGAVLEWECPSTNAVDGESCVSEKPHDPHGEQGHVWDRGSWPGPRSLATSNAGRRQEVSVAPLSVGVDAAQEPKA